MTSPITARPDLRLTTLLLAVSVLWLPGWTLAQTVAGARAPDHVLGPQELAIAQRIEVGRVACELGAFVQLTADARAPGFFDVQSQKRHFRMAPVATSTGAIRLEDARAGTVWLQLANKSMLMDQKSGRRLADACMTPSQQVASDALLANPPPSLLEPLASNPVAVTPVPSVY